MEFNDLIQADFLTVFIRGARYEVLNIVDTTTRYGERAIAPNQNGETLMNLIEYEWIYHHGPPRAFGADPEFFKGFFKILRQTNEIKLHARASR